MLRVIAERSTLLFLRRVRIVKYLTVVRSAWAMLARWRTSTTDQNGKTTTYTYDDADQLTTVTDPANNVTTYNYDTENNPTSITDANNHPTYFVCKRAWLGGADDVPVHVGRKLCI